MKVKKKNKTNELRIMGKSAKEVNNKEEFSLSIRLKGEIAWSRCLR